MRLKFTTFSTSTVILSFCPPVATEFSRSSLTSLLLTVVSHLSCFQQLVYASYILVFVLHARNEKVNKTCFLLIEDFSLMGKVDGKRNTMSKRYLNKNAQKNQRVCLILPGKSKAGFTYEVMFALIAGRKDEEL